jgi:ABC-type Mn2+/Zn2+ transport system permease subunit
MSLILDLATAPFAYEFMQRGLLASIIVGILCAVVGCYVVLRGMAFLGDAVAHAILPGVAVAYLLKADLLIGAAITAVAVALIIGFFTNPGKVKEDTAIGIVFAGALALGVALMSSVKTYSVDLTHILFGNVLAVSERDLWLTGGLTVLILLAVVLLFKELMIVCFDPILAAGVRLPVNLLRNGLLVM